MEQRPESIRQCLATTKRFIGSPRSLLTVGEKGCCKVTPFYDPIFGHPEGRAALERATTEFCTYLLLEDLKARHGEELFPSFLELLGADRDGRPPLRDIPREVSKTMPEGIQRGLSVPRSLVLHLEFLEGSVDLNTFIQETAYRTLPHFEQALESAIYLVLLTLHNLEWAATTDHHPTIFHNDLHLRNIIVACPPPTRQRQESLLSVRLGEATSHQVRIPSGGFRLAIIDFNLASLSDGTFNLSEGSPLNRVYGIGRSDRGPRRFFDVLFFLNSLYILLRTLRRHLVVLTGFEQKLMAWITEHIPRCLLGPGFRFADTPEQLAEHGARYHQNREPACKVVKKDADEDDEESFKILVEGRLSTFGSYIDLEQRGLLPSHILPIIKDRKACALERYFRKVGLGKPAAILAEQVIAGEMDFTPPKLGGGLFEAAYPTPAQLIRSLLQSQVFSGMAPSSSRASRGSSSCSAAVPPPPPPPPLPFDITQSFSPVSPATAPPTPTRKPEDEEIIDFGSDAED